MAAADDVYKALAITMVLWQHLSNYNMNFIQTQKAYLHPFK